MKGENLQPNRSKQHDLFQESRVRAADGAAATVGDLHQYQVFSSSTCLYIYTHTHTDITHTQTHTHRSLKICRHCESTVKL